MSIVKKISYIFSIKQKIQAAFLCIGLFIGAAMELVGVSLIAELVTLISAPETIQQNKFLAYLYSAFGATSTRDFFKDVVLALILVYLFKNIYLMLMSYIQYTFIYNNQLRLSGRPFVYSCFDS